MSDLLLHWINHELELSKFVVDVEADFASGYLLGEILHRLNHQHNFSDFMDSAIADAKIINFCLLEPSLRHLAIRFDSKIATAIMNGKSGAAANVLYQIKMVAQRLARAPEVSTRSLERKNILSLHNMPVKLAKPAYDAANHYFFEHSVRRQVKSLTGLKKERDARAAEARRKEKYREEQAQLQAQLEFTKAERLHRAFIHSEYIKTALDETDSPAWRMALQKKNDREQRRALFYSQLVADRAKRKEEHTFSLRYTVENDLDEFERVGSAKPRANGGRVPSQKSVGYGLRSLSAMLGQNQIADGSNTADPSMPIALGYTPELLKHSTVIQEQKKHRAKRQELLERRHKRFLQDALQDHSRINQARAAETLRSLVARETNREEESKSETDTVLIFKTVIRENRRLREEQYARRREIDQDAAVDRDVSSYELLFAKYNDDWDVQGIHQQHRRVAAQSAQNHKHALLIGVLLRELIDFGMFIAGKREETSQSRDANEFLDAETWSAYKFQFANDLAYDQKNALRDVRSAPIVASGDKCRYGLSGSLPYRQLLDYLQSFTTTHFTVAETGRSQSTTVSPWVPNDLKLIAAVEILEGRFILGEAIKYLRWLTSIVNENIDVASPNHTALSLAVPEGASLEMGDELEGAVEAGENSTAIPEGSMGMASRTPNESTVPSPLPESNEDMSTIPSVRDTSIASMPLEVTTTSHQSLKILLLGPSFAGKMTQANLLADRYGLAVISVQETLMAAIEEKSPLGLDAQDILISGEPLPSRIYSQLVLQAVAALESGGSNTGDSALDQANGAQLGIRRTGWIVHDLPPTEEQLRNLEEYLTGFVHPSQIPSPFDHESVVAPGCVKPALSDTFLYGKSGVDLVFYLACDDTSTLERCLGRVEDRVTHQSCHLLFEPPPKDSTDRHRLQHANKSVNASDILLLQTFSTSESSPPLRSWCGQFNTLREVNTARGDGDQPSALSRALTVDEMHLRLVEHIDMFFNDKAAEAEKKQADMARQEAKGMQEEEIRQARLEDFKKSILDAEQVVAKAQQAIQQAEESKAKKEEIMELRLVADDAKKGVENAMIVAHDWVTDESYQVRSARTKFSGKLTPAFGQLLCELWNEMETEYISTMTQSFRTLQMYRERVIERSVEVVHTFCTFVRRLDRKQMAINSFQLQFNTVAEEMRFDDSTKQELHARVDVLQDELIAILESRRSENEDELSAIMSDAWIEGSCHAAAITYLTALQAECDRFCVSIQLLVDAFHAASDDPLPLAGVIDVLTANPQAMEAIQVPIFQQDGGDTSAEQAPTATPVAATPPVPSPSSKTPPAAAKGGKGKPPLARVASKSSTPADPAPEEVNPVDALLPTYDLILERCDALVQLILNAPRKAGIREPAKAPEVAVAPHKPAGKTGHTPAGSTSVTPVPSVIHLPRQSIDVATSNCMKAIRYEHELMERRVNYLKDKTQTFCDQITRGMRAVETTLRNHIQERNIREMAAVAATLQYIRSVIEAEKELPYYINIQPDQVDRFPVTTQLSEDTVVVVDPSQRVIPQPPLEPPPVIEPHHPVLLNERQRDALVALLSDMNTTTTTPNSDLEAPAASQSFFVPMCEVLKVIHTLTTVPYALPESWRRCSEQALAKMMAVYADPDSGLLDVEALVDAMTHNEALFHEDEPLHSNTQ